MTNEELQQRIWLRKVTVDRYIYGTTKEMAIAEVNKHPGLRLVGIYQRDGFWVAECQFMKE